MLGEKDVHSSDSDSEGQRQDQAYDDIKQPTSRATTDAEGLIAGVKCRGGGYKNTC